MKCPNCFKKMSLAPEIDSEEINPRCLECHPINGMCVTQKGSRYFAEYRREGNNPCYVAAYGNDALEAEINLKAAIKEMYQDIFKIN